MVSGPPHQAGRLTRRLGLPLALLLASTGAIAGSLRSPTPDDSTRKIVFLAGPKDHGRPGRHEYEKDLRLIAGALERSPNLQGVTTKVFVGNAPRDLDEYKDTSAVVIESSSDRDEKETHPLFPPEPTTTGRTYDPETLAFLEDLDAMIQKGLGVVVFHYANWTEHWVARRYHVKWTGGLWVHAMSRNPVDQWTMTFPNPTHPVLRGVRPWTYRDEVFCRFFLLPDPRRTDLLIATPAESPVGPQVASWAYEREGGGRAFVMGGVDFHDNLSTVDDLRRFLLNGIVWAAGMDVPAGGVDSTVLGAAPE
jgi:type 1 glutamine amidotransferase